MPREDTLGTKRGGLAEWGGLDRRRCSPSVELMLQYAKALR